MSQPVTVPVASSGEKFAIVNFHPVHSCSPQLRHPRFSIMTATKHYRSGSCLLCRTLVEMRVSRSASQEERMVRGFFFHPSDIGHHRMKNRLTIASDRVNELSLRVDRVLLRTPGSTSASASQKKSPLFNQLLSCMVESLSLRIGLFPCTNKTARHDNVNFHVFILPRIVIAPNTI